MQIGLRVVLVFALLAGAATRTYAAEVTCEQAVEHVLVVMKAEADDPDEFDEVYLGDGYMAGLPKEMIVVCKQQAPSQAELVCLLGATSTDALGQCEPPPPPPPSSAWDTLSAALPALSADGKFLALRGYSGGWGESSEYVEVFALGKTSGELFECQRSSGPTDGAPLPGACQRV